MGRRPRTTTVFASAAAAAVTLYDVTQPRHAILQNFPLLGHARPLLDVVGPEFPRMLAAQKEGSD